MKNILKSFIALSLVLGGSSAFAKTATKQEPNCEIKGKKKHVKDQATCEKDKGKFLAPVVAPTAGSGSASGSGSVAGLPSGSGSQPVVEGTK